MKLSIVISAFATATLVSADLRHQHQHQVLHEPSRKLTARDGKCPRPMCKTPASQGPKDPPACGDSFAACEFDKFPCDPYFTPKWTDTHHCYCILATKKAMDSFCQSEGFKGGNNPWKNYYAVECYGAANNEVCNKDCHDQGRGNGRINKAKPNGPCACDKPNPPYDVCKKN